MKTHSISTINALKSKITKHAHTLGFDVVGFSLAKIEEKYIRAYRKWIEAGNHADMTFLESSEKFERILDMQKVLPNAQAVVVVAMNYYRPQSPLKQGHGRIARYAYGRDYHKIMGAKLKKLRIYVDVLAKQYFPAETHDARSFVDVGPLLEHALAEQAGVGSLGKNSLLITKEFGSWVVLGEIVTTLPLVLPVTQSTDKQTSNARKKVQTEKTLASEKSFSACGSCTRCIQACPTGAIIAPGVVDARKCLSYITIEHEGRIPAKLKRALKKTKKLFGCDICQEVCPHNSRQKITTHAEFTEQALATDSLYFPSLRNIKTDSLFFRKFAGSGLMCPGRTGMRRNAKAL